MDTEEKYLPGWMTGLAPDLDKGSSLPKEDRCLVYNRLLNDYANDIPAEPVNGEMANSALPRHKYKVSKNWLASVMAILQVDLRTGEIHNPTLIRRAQRMIEKYTFDISPNALRNRAEINKIDNLLHCILNESKQVINKNE